MYPSSSDISIVVLIVLIMVTVQYHICQELKRRSRICARHKKCAQEALSILVVNGPNSRPCLRLSEIYLLLYLIVWLWWQSIILARNLRDDPEYVPNANVLSKSWEYLLQTGHILGHVRIYLRLFVAILILLWMIDSFPNWMILVFQLFHDASVLCVTIILSFHNVLYNINVWDKG